MATIDVRGWAAGLGADVAAGSVVAVRDGTGSYVVASICQLRPYQVATIGHRTLSADPIRHREKTHQAPDPSPDRLSITRRKRTCALGSAKPLGVGVWPAGDLGGVITTQIPAAANTASNPAEKLESRSRITPGIARPAPPV